jgi:hypothetical protein
MNKPVVLGKNIYLNIPEEEDRKVIVDQNTKEALEKELLRKLKKLEVWAVGESANPQIAVGDWVLVDPAAISQAKMVEFDDGVTRALVLDYHIIHIWQ